MTPILKLTSALTPVNSPTANESVTHVNTVPAPRVVNTREMEVVVKEFEVAVPESNNSESNNSSSTKVLSLKTDLLATVKLGTAGTHLHALLQHTDLGLLDLLNKVIAVVLDPCRSPEVL